MKCPVCDKVHKSVLCPNCGFDSSMDYGKYPTFGPVGKAPAVSALRREWGQGNPPPPKKKPWLAIAVCAAIFALGIWIGAGLGGGKAEPTEPVVTTTAPLETTTPLETTAPPETTTPSETTEPPEPAPDPAPWQDNILRSDTPADNDGDGVYWLYEVRAAPVFGSDYRREQISSVTFLETLTDAPETAWDVSAAENGRVMAWVTPNGDRYDLYIGAEGGVWAGESCARLFDGYANATHITFGNAFHTENVQDMKFMFSDCSSLTELTLGDGFDTSNVRSMFSMFSYCGSLRSLTFGEGFDTSNVQSMYTMFYYCSSLRSLTLDEGFDTSNVQTMCAMFNECSSLTDLTLGEGFVTTNADTSSMFYNCPAGDDYQHLLH